MSDSFNHLGSIWYQSEPLEVPCFSNQFLGLDFFAISYSKPALATTYMSSFAIWHSLFIKSFPVSLIFLWFSRKYSLLQFTFIWNSSYFRFHNDDYMPFLQWIPGGGRRPQLVQPTLFQGHVDLDFRSVHYCDHTGEV